MNRIDKLLFQDYKKVFLKNPVIYFNPVNLIKEVRRNAHGNDLKEYVLSEMCRGLFAIKLDTVLKEAGFGFYDFIENEKFRSYCAFWDATQIKNAENMLLDKKIMKAVIKQINTALSRMRIILSSSFPETQIWTDKINFVESLDYEGYEFIDLTEDADYLTLHQVSRYIYEIIVK